MDGIGEHHLKLARIRRPKAACFLSYMEYRSNTNSNIMKNAKGRSYTR
jgi:hypothetical protein